MIFNLLHSIVTIVAHLIIEYATLKTSRSLRTHILVRISSISCLLFLYWILSRLDIRDGLPYYCASVVQFVALVYLFDEGLSQKIFLFFASWGVFTFVQSVTMWLGTRIASPGLASATRLLLYAACSVVFLLLYRKYWRDRVREILFLYRKGNPVYAALPFFAFVLFTSLFGPVIPPSSWQEFGLMVLFEILIFFTYYLFFSHLHVVYGHLQAEIHVENMERQLLLQKKYYEEVDKGSRSRQKLLQDSRHHLEAMASLAQAGDRAALEAYIEQMLVSFSESPTTHYCQNSVANAVIGGYLRIAEEQGIAVSAALDLPAELGIDDYDVCALFGNTVENAIEACQRILPDSESYRGRFLHIRSRVEKGHLVIRIENSVHASQRKENGDFLSSKGAMGGIGLESVKAVVALYQGSLSYEQRENVFVLSAVLCLPDSGEVTV